MRLVQVLLPPGERQAVLDVLEDEGIDYALTEEGSGRKYTGVVYFPLPVNAVEPVLARLHEVGLEEDAYTVVLSAETVVSRKFDALKSQYDDADSAQTDRIAREELHSRAAGLVPSLPTYVLMTAVSALIATAGLLLDSPATVVGSMVIAPLIGPAMAASVGTVVDDRDLFRTGVKLQVGGILLSVVTAGAFAAFVRYAHFVPPGLDVLAISEIRERLRPDVLSLVVALGAGVAGVLSLSTGVSSALVGVAIAVALVPPAATVGICLAFGLPTIGLGAAILVLVNILSINLAALVVLWYSGYRPQQWLRVDDARSATLKRVGVLVAGILVLSVFLGGVTFSTLQTATAEQSIRTTIEDTLDEPQYEGYTVLSVEFQYSRGVLFRTPSRAVVAIGVPPGGTPTDLASVLNRRVEGATGRDISLQIRYVEVETVD
ncbi:TIGR00341 family protein [Salarchaeum sp. JOR-1]|uniref:TIGR00341 family protein n=1 Tax=Salarchaeum sp. JOR-1 TaxID=2599399 RepID=UPI001198C249|nr:TIGR00341 family protein [Salarchaeum sp. JOR-1]QDX40016.1 TIGR00341 family protein [Salarchaeum sp. JOR-1]